MGVFAQTIARQGFATDSERNASRLGITRMKWLKRGLFLLVAVALVGVAGAWFMSRNNGAADGYRTAPVTRGDVISTIGATGVVQPEEVVDVGAQVAGQVEAFGKDVTGQPVDHG